VSGSVFFQNTIQGNSGWRNIASPVSTTIGDLLEDQLRYNIATTGGSVYKWNAATSQWAKPNAITDAYDATTPYTVFFGTSVVGSASYVFNNMPFTAEVFGPPNNGNVDNTLYYHSGSGGVFAGPNADGWNLIANPYPENLDWTTINTHADFLGGDINGSYYIWDASQSKYLSHNGSSGDAELAGTIAPMQSFYVKLNNVGATNSSAFDVTNSMRTATKKAQFLKTGVESITLSLINQNTLQEDKTYIAFDADATKDFDAQWDAYQLKFNPVALALIYTAEYEGGDTTLLAINSVPASQTNYLIPVYIEAPANGNFMIALDSTSVNPVWEIELIRVTDSAVVDLRLTDASFAYQTTDNLHRFWLRINSSAVGIDDFETGLSRPKIWLDQSALQIETEVPAEVITTVRIMNAAGQIMYESGSISENRLAIPRWSIPLRSGLLIVELITSKNSYKQKIIMAY